MINAITGHRAGIKAFVDSKPLSDVLEKDAGPTKNAFRLIVLLSKRSMSGANLQD